MSILRICLGATLVVTAIGCGAPADPASSSTTMRLTGTADRSTMKLDNAKAVAQAANGKVYSAYLDRSGHFTLDLPPNAAYHVSIANTTRKGQLHLLGHIVNTTSSGQTSWLGIHSSGKLPLGLVSIKSSRGGLHAQCGCGGSGGGSGGGDHGGHADDGSSDGEPDHDFESHEEDDDGDRSCSGSSSGTEDVDLHADNEPGDRCDSSDVDTDAEKPEHKGHHSCGEGSSDGEGSGGGGGGSCYCTSQCPTGDTCVASKCVPPTPAPTPPTPPAPTPSGIR
jgi:hypothetical protein